MANLFQPSLIRGLDSNANPVPFGELRFDYSGTTTLATIYEDQAGSVEHENPLPADSAGVFPPVYLNPETTYRVRWFDQDGALVPGYDIDPVRGYDEGMIQTAAQAVLDGIDHVDEVAAQVEDAAAAVADDAAQASTDADAAAAAAAQAAVSALAAGAYPNSAVTYVPQGVSGTGAITGGSGGTNGTFALAFSGGNFSANPTGTFTVSGGAVTSITFTAAGLYIGSSPTAPTLSFAASTGLTGASATATVGYRVANGSSYWALSSDGNYVQNYTNVAGTPTLNTGLTIPTKEYLDLVAENVTARDDLSTLQSATIDDMQFPWETVSASPPSTLSAEPTLFTKYDWEIIAACGQSVMTGVSSGTTVISSDTVSGLKMLSTGIRQNTSTAASGVGSATITDAVEAYVNPEGETPVRGIMKAIVEGVERYTGLTYADHGIDLIGFTWGLSGASLSSLVQGTTSYNRMLAVITRIKALATAAGKTCCVRAIPFWQGQTGPFSNYGTLLADFIADLNTDIKAITTQTEDIKLLVVQECGLTFYGGTANADANRHVAQQQLAQCETDPLIEMCVPDYFIGTVDGIHPLNQDAKHIGGILGRHFVEGCLFATSKWEPLLPAASKSINGKLVSIDFTGPADGLVFDTHTVIDPGNYGFTLYQSDGTTAITINRVWIAGMTVHILANAAVPSDAILRYAWGTTSGSSIDAGRLLGARGCLRSAENEARFNLAALNRPFLKFAPLFQR